MDQNISGHRMRTWVNKSAEKQQICGDDYSNNRKNLRNLNKNQVIEYNYVTFVNKNKESLVNLPVPGSKNIKYKLHSAFSVRSVQNISQAWQLVNTIYSAGIIAILNEFSSMISTQIELKSYKPW